MASFSQTPVQCVFHVYLSERFLPLRRPAPWRTGNRKTGRDEALLHNHHREVFRNWRRNVLPRDLDGYYTSSVSILSVLRPLNLSFRINKISPYGRNDRKSVLSKDLYFVI